MSPELPPFVNARARSAAAAPRSRRVSSPRTARRRSAAATASAARRGLLAVIGTGALVLGWYLISVDQQQQQTNREQTSRVNAIAPGP